jgi:chaperone BCS1
MFSGGFALGVVGAIGMWVKSSWGTLRSFVMRKVLTSLEVREDDEAFQYVENWLNEHPYSNKNTQLSVKTEWFNRVPRFMLIPSPGLHIFRDGARWLWVTKSREKLENSNYSGKAYTDTLYINTFFGGKHIIEKLLNDAWELERNKIKPSISIKYYNKDYWVSCNTKDITAPNMLSLTPEQQELMDDAENFVNSKEWYGEQGIPWRRGYLFFGKPGNGKSSIITEIAKKIRYDVCFLSLSGNEVTDSKLISMMSEAGSRSIIVIEEIDTVFDKREKTDDAGVTNTLTFGGLLNVLDGVVARDGRIVVMTTNHPEKLDAALCRPGRVDKRLEFQNASQDQITNMVDRFFPDSAHKDIIANHLFARDVSMADLQEYCISHRYLTDDELARILVA